MAERALTAGVLSAILSGVVRPVLFTELEYVSVGVPAFLRLHTGIGSVSWDGKTWTGGGEMLGITPIKESRGLEAIGFAVRIAGLPADKLSIALASMRKNRSGKVWLGFYDPAAYLSLPGTSGNYASTPDSVAASVTGDIDVRMKVAPDDWSPAANEAFVAKFATGTPERSFRLLLVPSGALRFLTSPDGVTEDLSAQSSSSNLSALAGGTVKWVRATRAAATGLLNYYTSDDGESWALLGTANRTSAAGNIFDGAAKLNVGASLDNGTGQPLAGKAYYAEVRNGIDGPVVAKFDPRRFSSTNLTAEMMTGEIWTINQSGSPAANIVHLPDELIADHYLLRRGRFDIAPITRDGDTMTIEARYEDRLVDLERPRERRYTHEDQQLRLPGDLGFEQVPELQDAADAWGEPGPLVTIPNPVGGRFR